MQRVPTPSIPKEIPADSTPSVPEMAPETSKKGKGKDKTPKNTPKLETSFASPLFDSQKTPKLGDSLSAAWGSVNPSADLLSPLTPAELKPPQIADSSPMDKEKGILFDSISRKPSPAISASRSPLGVTEPIVAADLIDPPVDPTPVAEAIDTVASQSKPVVETDVAKEPVVQVATPAVETTADVGFQEAAPAGKKKKKKGASAATTPTVEPTASLDSTPVVPDPPPVEESKAVVAEPEAETRNLDPVEEPVVQVATPAVETTADVGFQEAAPVEKKKKKKKGASAAATPAVEPTASLDSTPVVPDPPPVEESKAVVAEQAETRNIDPAEEVTNTVLGDPLASADKPDSTKAPPALLPELSATDGGGGLFGTDSAASALFADNIWGNSTDKAQGTPDAQDNPQPPKTPKTPGWGAGGLGFGAKSGATTPKSPATPWGAATTPAAKTPSLGWGATTPKAAWGAKPAASPGSAANGSPWGKKPEPEIAPEADKPTEADKPLETPAAESEKPVEPVGSDPAPTTSVPTAETEDKDALAKPEAVELGGSEEIKGVDTTPAETPAPVAAAEETLTPEGDNIPAAEGTPKDGSPPPIEGANAEGGDEGEDDKGDGGGGGKGKKGTKKKKKKGRG